MLCLYDITVSFDIMPVLEYLSQMFWFYNLIFLRVVELSLFPAFSMKGKRKKKKSKTHSSWNYTEMKGYTLKTVKTKPNNSKNKSQKIHIPLSELFCPNLIITGQ